MRGATAGTNFPRVVLAIVSDLHGNLPALEAVLADVGTADALVCCGDLVGYYPDAAEVVDRVRGLGALAVRGNHELMVTGARAVPPERAAYYAVETARRALDVEQRAWLAALPPSRTLAAGDVVVDVRHASPWDEDTYLYPDSDLGAVAPPEGGWLVLGHTHYPMLRRVGAGVVANPGSVGQPRDWDPRAAWARLDTATGRWEQRRVAYDHRAYQARLARMGVDPRAIALLGRERAGAAGARGAERVMR
jgi:predicted phosphodiesterase